MKILLFGKNGQLGWELQRALAPLGHVAAVDYPEVDLADGAALRKILQEQPSDVVLNAAAYTDVDGAEAERGRPFAINAEAPGIMAEEARTSGAILVHYSTDYVFDGRKGAAYVEADAPHPLNVYGESKLAGEQAVAAVGGDYLIFRTAWLYSMRGSSFVTKVLSWARQQEVLRIVDDQISNPTWARTLAGLTGEMLQRGTDHLRERRGLYHLAGGGYASRLEWAKKILQLDPRRDEQRIRELRAASTSEFPTPAERPLFSALDCRRWEDVFDLKLPPWADELQKALGTTAQQAAGH